MPETTAINGEAKREDGELVDAAGTMGEPPPASILPGGAPEPKPSSLGAFPMKLMINRETNRVLFAECEYSVLGGIVRLLRFPFGSITSSFSSMSHSSLAKLKCSLRALGIDHNPRNRPRVCYFMCGACEDDSPYVTDRCGATCPLCERLMISPVRGEANCWEEREEDLLVKESGRTYLMMDDLKVEPCLSTISVVSLLRELGVVDTSVLEERVVSVTCKMAEKIFEASFTSTTVLSDVFLDKEMKLEPKSKRKRSLDKKAKLR